MRGSIDLCCSKACCGEAVRCVESKLEAAREILGFWGRAWEKGETNAEIVEKARKEVERWDELVPGEVVRHRDWEERRANVWKHQASSR